MYDNFPSNETVLQHRNILEAWPCIIFVAKNHSTGYSYILLKHLKRCLCSFYQQYTAEISPIPRWRRKCLRWVDCYNCMLRLVGQKYRSFCGCKRALRRSYWRLYSANSQTNCHAPFCSSHFLFNHSSYMVIPLSYIIWLHINWDFSRNSQLYFETCGWLCNASTCLEGDPDI